MKITSIETPERRGSLARAMRPEIARAMAVERRHLANGFAELEGEICDLTRSARLACEQVYRAIGELTSEGEKCTEIPDGRNVELAIFAVGQTLKMARSLESLYYRLHNGACQAAGPRNKV